METNSLYARLAKARAAMPKITTDSTANTGKYIYHFATLPNVMEAIREPLEANGIWFSQFPTIEDGEVNVYLLLYDVDGNVVNVSVPCTMPIVDKSPQQIGTIISYARRYQIISAFGLAPNTDDDAQSAQESYMSKQQASKAIAKATKPVTKAITPPPKAEKSKAADSTDIPYLEDVVGMFNDAAVEFSQAETDLILRMRELDGNSRFKMFTEPREGKKYSQYGFLASKLNEYGKDEYTHNYLLSCMLGRVVNKENPPGSDCKELLDKIMENDEQTTTTLAELMDTITDYVLWIKQENQND